MHDYILAIDQGTTGSTALLVDPKGIIKAKSNVEFPQIFPKPLWVEHDLNAIWNSVCQAIQNVLTAAKTPLSSIKAIGITNQRETIGCWERTSGKPIGHAIVWQCRRTADFCKKLQPHAKQIYETTGLVLDAYFSASKIQWLIEHHALDGRQDICFGTIDSYLVYRLTNCASFVTEPSNASRTMLMNIRTLNWDQDLLDLFAIDSKTLPKICRSSDRFGVTKGLGILPDGIPITGILGDQQAALFGQACFEKGQTKCTYGTGAFLLSNTGSTIVRSKHRLLSTVAWHIDDQVTYALEGSVFMAGACIQWLRDGLKIIDDASDVEALAQQCDNSDGVILIPSFTGMGAPYWDPDAKAALMGLTRGSKPSHIARATLEAIALQVWEVLSCMEQDMGIELKALNVDGGASQNQLLMQLQADILNCALLRPRQIESTGLGAAYLAGLGAGMWQSLDEIKTNLNPLKTFTPEDPAGPYHQALKHHWKKKVHKYLKS